MNSPPYPIFPICRDSGFYFFSLTVVTLNRKNRDTSIFVVVLLCYFIVSLYRNESVRLCSIWSNYILLPKNSNWVYSRTTNIGRGGKYFILRTFFFFLNRIHHNRQTYLHWQCGTRWYCEFDLFVYGFYRFISSNRNFYNALVFFM